MPYEINETHDPSLESWVESANDPGTDFPIQNLPICSFQRPRGHEINGQRVNSSPCVACIVGDQLIDIQACDLAGLVRGVGASDFVTYDLNDCMINLKRADWQSLRIQLSKLLRKDNATLRDNKALRRDCMHPIDADRVNQMWPIGNYTDFYASLFHATNVGSMFRPDNPLLPNYKWIPIGYHGRASSIVPSGAPVVRPVGQLAPPEDGSASRPTLSPCKMLDYELEVGMVIGRGNTLGEPISIDNAEDHIFGLCLVNDWSARDIQKWEYVPLGPFLSKSFATTVSPYIVTMEALAPFRTPAYERPASDPQPLAYLDGAHNRAMGGFDITLEVWLSSAQMRERGIEPIRLSKGGFKDMYWTLAQMVTHHTVNGCNLQPGDLLASGTVSGKTRDSRGSMLELTWDGDPFATPPKVVPGTARTPIRLPTGEERRFLADGDEVILKGYCEREGFRRIGFGECRGVIKPARV